MKDKQCLWKAVLWSATIAWMGLVLFFTLQSGTGTTATSNKIAGLLYRILIRCGMAVSYLKFHQTLRSVAHFIVFFVFGLLYAAAILIGKEETSVSKTPFMVIVACTAISVVPEVMKLWIPGRHLQWDEVLLNLFDVYAGIFVIYGIWYVFSR